jgi:hypothetical protein
MPAPICPYCNKSAVLVTGHKIYPHRTDLYSKHFWHCEPCDAYVGCHPQTINPLGRLANKELRQAKMAAHTAFDPIWQSEEMTRSEAYAWLATTLGISLDDCHMGMFDVDTCERVVEACEKRVALQMPQPLASPDWTEVVKVCQERLQEYLDGNETDSDIPHYIYEAAIKAVFGPGVWEWIRAVVKNRKQV